ncbi:MAG: hypothetical protein DDT32_01730 [Syntrophomonadaceae bacterium]|nr:hypothetical protein [Bacillota bacterium]
MIKTKKINVKKVEFVANCLDVRTIIEEMEQVGIDGYSVIRGVSGRGKHGKTLRASSFDSMASCYIMVVCPEAQAEALVVAVTPLLKRSGGICLVSDVQEVDLE